MTSNHTSLLLLGKLLTYTVIKKNSIQSLEEVEFKVFSQFGDDGIIQYLIRKIKIDNRVFIEFGVEKYVESNTRFLLINNNWKGLVIDCTESDIQSIKTDDIYWKYNITAVSKFITRENINEIFISNNIVGEIGILSIDVDGNDYWVWESITSVKPAIVIIEYNSVFGPDFAITIPYKSTFNRTKAHYSNLYWGSSLKALISLGTKKGYNFIGCNSNGNNAYFVKKDKMGKLKKKNIRTGYVISQFRESRDKKGNLTFISDNDRLKTIKDLVVFDIEKKRTISIFNLYFNKDY